MVADDVAAAGPMKRDLATGTVNLRMPGTAAVVDGAKELTGRLLPPLLLLSSSSDRGRAGDGRGGAERPEEEAGGWRLLGGV